jgi:hypothetical protein
VTRGERVLRGVRRALVVVAALLPGPLAVLASGPRESSDLRAQAQAPRSAPAASAAPSAPSESDGERNATVQVYGARTYGWRGAFGIHTWIAVRRRDAPLYTVYQVIGWSVYRGGPAISVRQVERADFRWFNAEPQLLAQRRGADAEPLIDRVEAAVAAYPWPLEYRVWPGPNSNTFTAFVARQVPELGLDLPSTAIGKDYLAGGRIVDRTPSGSGWQFSLLGLFGVSLALEEGLEINLLGLSFGLDLNDPALRLPGIGRLGADASIKPPGPASQWSRDSRQPSAR